VAYGRAFGDRLALGVTGKWIHAKIDDIAADALAVEAGGLYRCSRTLNFGASVNNVGPSLKFLSDRNPLPTTFHGGFAWRPGPQWLASTEGVYSRNGAAGFRVGGQWRPLEAISLRAGYRTDNLQGLSPLAGVSMGVGIDVLGQEFAYAWAPYGELGSAQYFSLVARFGSREPAGNLVQYRQIRRHRMDKNSPTDPELHQLMQLLSDDEAQVASR
jgi:hypothetical protein